MNFIALVRNPFTSAILIQIIGLVVAGRLDCLSEAVIASVLFWPLANKLARRKPCTKVDIFVIRYGLILLLGIVLVIWGR